MTSLITCTGVSTHRSSKLQNAPILVGLQWQLCHLVIAVCCISLSFCLLSSLQRHHYCLSVCLCLSICLSVCLSVCLFVYLFVCLSICLFVYWSVCLSVCLFVLSVCLSVYLSIGLSVRSVCLFVCLSVCLFMCLSVCLSICLSTYLSAAQLIYINLLSQLLSQLLDCWLWTVNHCQGAFSSDTDMSITPNTQPHNILTKVYAENSSHYFHVCDTNCHFLVLTRTI